MPPLDSEKNALMWHTLTCTKTKRKEIFENKVFLLLKEEEEKGKKEWKEGGKKKEGIQNGQMVVLLDSNYSTFS